MQDGIHIQQHLNFEHFQHIQHLTNVLKCLAVECKFMWKLFWDDWFHVYKVIRFSNNSKLVISTNNTGNLQMQSA